MLTSVYLYGGIAVVIIVLVIVILIMVNSKTKKGRILKQINNLEDEKLEISKNNVNAKLIKISMIGQSNVIFQSIYNENKQVYDSIMKEYSDSLDAAIKETRDLCMSGDYKKVSENIKAISIRLDSFRDEMNSLNEEVSKVLKDEDDLNKQIDPLKVKFNECESLYVNYKTNIDFNIEKYDMLFANIKDKFAILNDYMLRGNYLDAKDLVVSLYKEINFLYDNLNNSPRIVNIIINEIPSLLNKVIDKYNTMQQGEYPLYNVSATQQISTIKEELKLLINKIQNFEYDNLEEKTKIIESKIDKLNLDLDKEQDSRQDYEERMKTTYDLASDLEGLYLSNLRKHTTWEKVYNTNSELDNKMNAIKEEVNTLNCIRRRLDSLNYGMQPYSIRLDKLNELDQQNKKVQSMIDSYNDYIVSMRDVCENSNDLVKNSASTLKRLELKVRNSNVSGLINMYNDSFVNGYQLISKLEELFKITPIDVKKCEVYTSRLEELVSELKTSLDKDLLLLKEAEELLMFSAQYKNDYADFEKAHIKAKGYFYNCRYENAIELLIDALNKIQIEVPFEIRGLK